MYIGRRYGDFARLHKRLRTELPGKVLPPLPRKNKSSTSSTLLNPGDDDASSVSSVSTQDTGANIDGSSGFRNIIYGHRRSESHRRESPRGSTDKLKEIPVTLYREDQRVSLRAFLRTYLQNAQIASTKSIHDFLTANPIKLNEEELTDMERRKVMDKRRIEEQKRFYDIARQRARALDVYMEKFRRDIVERNGLSQLFKEIKEKETIADLAVEYQKFAEWLRIEVAATIYHLFLAEDNSPELFAQAKRIHSMIPYTALKQVIRFANPALVMSGVLDLFLAQPFGSRSLAQRAFGLAINDGIRTMQKSIDSLAAKIDDPILCTKIQAFTDLDESNKNMLRAEAASNQEDLIVTILRSEHLQPELSPEQIGKVFNAYVAWTAAVENVDAEMKAGAQLFASMKQLLKMQTRRRDKAQMLSVIEEPVTLQLFRDLFTIFYEPLVRVYKSANVYNSVTDFSSFLDDMFAVLERAQRQDISADPNQTVQSFIDLCGRHQDNFYKFVHEVHIHDNGLFSSLMTWLEGILEFLRHGPKGGKLDMNALFQGSVEMKQIDKAAAIAEIDALIKWQEERKKWHQDKTRQKMAAQHHHNNNTTTSSSPPAAATGTSQPSTPLDGTVALPATRFRTSDFGLDEQDVADLQDSYNSSLSSASESEIDSLDGGDGAARAGRDPIASERRRRTRAQDHLRRTAGEPVKPEVREVKGMKEGFLTMLRMVLAD